MGLMKIGNIVPRVGIESTSLAFRANVLLLHRCHYSTHDHLSMQLFVSERSVQITTLPYGFDVSDISQYVNNTQEIPTRIPVNKIKLFGLKP